MRFGHMGTTMDMRERTGPQAAEEGGRDRARPGEAIEPLLALCAGVRSVEAAAGDALRRLHPRLGATHAAVLVRLALDGQACRSELQNRLALPGSSVGDALRVLESVGLVERGERGADARFSPARLTQAGTRAARDVRQQLTRVAQRVDRAARESGTVRLADTGAALRRAAHETGAAARA